MHLLGLCIILCTSWSCICALTSSPQIRPSFETNHPPYSPSSPILTSAVLQVSFDGTHFFGWIAPNEGTPISSDTYPWNSSFHQRKRSRRGRRHMLSSSSLNKKPIVVRSVVGVLTKALAKIYGDVDATRIQVEGSSRTDRGVHAHGMIALVYCLTEDAVLLDTSNNARYPPTPQSPDDVDYFLPLPFHGDLNKLISVLNRMLPQDVRVMNVSRLPRFKHNQAYVSHAFHPSVNAESKTYQYTISIGNIHDPLRCRHVWHVEDLYGDFNQTQAQLCCQLFMGTHDFQAFSCSDRGSTRLGDTIRTISNFCIHDRPNDEVKIVDGLLQPILLGENNGNPRQSRTKTYQILVTGNRFMYKMVRILIGAVIAVGMGKETLSSVQNVLDTGVGDRYKFCAPAHGLALLNVSYPTNYTFTWQRNSHTIKG